MRPSGVRLVHLVRHGEAVARLAWEGLDELRPLTEEGHRQAEAIARRLVPDGRPSRLARALSSPAVRCVDTLRPVAARAGVEVEPSVALVEGADPRTALDQLLAASEALEHGWSLVACTHGDVVDGVLAILSGSGFAVDGPKSCPKGATWEILFGAGGAGTARFVGPPVRQP